MFAEPVNMTADRDTVRLSLANSLQLDEQESHELVAALNAHFAIDGLQFFAPFGDRWYVRFSAAEIPETTSPEVAQFKSLADMQPRSYGTLNWRAIQNEAQMLLFTHPVNEARERQGRAVVSGVWFWGGGVRPLLERTPYTCVIARDPLSLQLAAQSGATTLPFSPDSLALAGTDSLLIIPSCAEAMPYFAFAWVDEMTALETIWFQRLSKLLAEGHIEKLNLILPASGTTHTFHATHNNHRLRFWRSTKPLAAYA